MEGTEERVNRWMQEIRHESSVRDARAANDMLTRWVDEAGHSEGKELAETREDVEGFYPLCKKLLRIYERPESRMEVMLVMNILSEHLTFGERLSLAQAMAYAMLEDEDEAQAFIAETPSVHDYPTEYRQEHPDYGS